MWWDHNYWNVFSLYYIKGKDFLEGWGFSLGHDCINPIGFFLKHKFLLERFIQYFDVVGKDLVDTSDKKKLAVYHENFTFFQKSSEDKDKDKIINFMHQTHLNKLSVDYEDHSVHLTQRQGECLYYLTQQYSVKEIAQTLDLSNRTIEVYIQTVKDKIGASSKGDLLKFI